MNEPDPKFLKLVRDLDEERQRRITAEKQATALRGVLKRMKAQRTQDAQSVQHEQRAGC
jgi:hypothetical protein